MEFVPRKKVKRAGVTEGKRGIDEGFGSRHEGTEPGEEIERSRGR